MSKKRVKVQAVWFCADDVWIMDGTNDEPWQWRGSVQDFLSILISHPELDITKARFFVKESID